MNGPVPVTTGGLAGAAALIVVNGVLSFWLGLGLERRLLLASARTIVQLLLLGYILVPIFRWQNPALVVGACVVMVVLASREAVRRGSRRYRRAWLHTFVALCVSALATGSMAVGVLIHIEPWWQPRYLIPLVGMILGNGLTGISLGLDRCLSELDDGRDRIEARLAFGATWWEAARPVATESLRAGMIPILNTMSVVGLVTIPGMMTGQLLGGTPPEQAARYQILIIFLIAAATGLGTLISVLMSLRRLFDREHRLRSDRIIA